MALNYGEKRRFVARTEDDRKAFVLLRSAGATSEGYKLKQYDGSDLNFLEDFGIDSRHPETIAREAKKRIRFYVGEEAEIEEVEL